MSGVVTLWLVGAKLDDLVQNFMIQWHAALHLTVVCMYSLPSVDTVSGVCCKHAQQVLKFMTCCRGLIRSHADAFGNEGDLQSQNTQSRIVRQRSNPEQPSQLTSMTELLQEVSQETHEGDQHCRMMQPLPLTVPAAVL